MKGNFKGKPQLNLLGQRFGNLLIIRYAGTDGHHSIWEVKCDCGITTIKVGTELRRGTKTCSKRCPFSRAKISAARTTHGLSQHPIFHVWRSMLARCNNPNCKAYKNYGGRGILVCSEWGDFEAFFSDMGSGYREGLTLDRTNNEKGYFPGNCRWVPMKTNCRNKRGNRIIDTPKGRMLLSEAAEISGLGVTTLGYRLQHNWPVDKLFLPADFANHVVS